MLVRSCFLIILIKCLKGHKSLESLCNVKSKSQAVSESVTRSPIELLWTAKNMKGRKDKKTKVQLKTKSKTVLGGWVDVAKE